MSNYVLIFIQFFLVLFVFIFTSALFATSIIDPQRCRLFYTQFVHDKNFTRNIFIYVLFFYVMKRLHVYLKHFFSENVAAMIDLFSPATLQTENNIQIRPIQIKRSLNSVDFMITSIIFLISSLQISCLTKLENIGLWSISFLFNNLVVNSAVLLLRYFPYQIINYVNKTRQNIKLLSKITIDAGEDIPLVRQQNLNDNLFGELK